MTDPKQLRKTLAATILGSSLVFLDSTIVNVLLPTLRRVFALSLSQSQWVIQGYLLFLSALLLLGGGLGDQFGRKKIFKVGIYIFALSSLACALAPNFHILVMARALQGVGGALLTPGSLAIINAVFPKAQRGRAIGTWASCTTLAVAAGPVMGGFLADHFSWRWAFGINLPFALLSLYFTHIAVPETCSESRTASLDLLGALLATVSLCGLTYGLMQHSWSFGLGSLLLLLAFLYHEAKTKSPILPLGLFRNRLFSATNLLTFFVYAALGILTFMLPFQIIEVHHYSAWQAGAANLPFIAMIFLLSRPAGALLDRYGPRLPLILGPVIVSGILLLLPSLSLAHASYSKAYLFPMLIMGIGMALTITPLTTTVMSAVGESQSGIASGINNAVARLSSLLAIAVLPWVTDHVFGVPYSVSSEVFNDAMRFAAALAFCGACFGTLIRSR